MKKIVLMPILAFTLACNAVLGTPTVIPTDAPTSAPIVPTGIESAPDPGETLPSPTPFPAFVEIRLVPRDGDLPSQLASESRKAFDMGLIPVVEFDADW